MIHVEERTGLVRGNMSLPQVMDNPPMMMMVATIIQMKKTLILSMRSCSIQVIVVS